MNSFVFSNSSGCSLSTPNAYCSLVRSISITRTFAFSSAFASVSLEAASLDASSEAFSEETSSEEASSEDTFSVSFSVAASVFFSVAASVFFSVAASVAFVEAAVVVFLSLLFEPHPASITAAAIETAVIDANTFLIIYSPLFGCLSVIAISYSHNYAQ